MIIILKEKKDAKSVSYEADAYSDQPAVFFTVPEVKYRRNMGRPELKWVKNQVKLECISMIARWRNQIWALARKNKQSGLVDEALSLISMNPMLDTIQHIGNSK